MNDVLTLGFSPCPNDCFMFEAMVHGKIDTEGLLFKLYMEDVETLNQRAFKSELDITKLSFYAFAYCTETYQLLSSGSALGFGCGPIVVRSSDPDSHRDGIRNLNMEDAKIAIPGKYTTANFLFSLAYPEAKNKTEMLFSEIEDAVQKGNTDAGVIIHENRFTYEKKGLKKIVDLGEYWEKLTGLPIPLGGIVVKRNFPDALKQKINRVIRRSIEYAFANPKSSLPFVKQHAQEMEEEVIYKHIDLYVNAYSIELGEEGKKAVEVLFEKARKTGVIKNHTSSLFVD